MYSADQIKDAWQVGNPDWHGINNKKTKKTAQSALEPFNVCLNFKV